MKKTLRRHKDSKRLSRKSSKASPDAEQGSYISEILETLVFSFAVLLVIYWFVALPEVVVGASMEPTIYSGERILVERVTRHFRDFERGDIVVINPPGTRDIDYIKRVVGIPGDTIKIFDCKVYIFRDEERYVLEEPYLDADICTSGGIEVKDGRSIKLEKDEYIVLGDNRGNSADSRLFGKISESRFVGRVVVRFWPPDKLNLF